MLKLFVPSVNQRDGVCYCRFAGTIAPASSGGLPILILDELDSGIGARLGSAVGSILARMAAPYTYGSGTAAPTRGSTSQVICVTHLPQVGWGRWDRHVG